MRQCRAQIDAAADADRFDGLNHAGHPSGRTFETALPQRLPEAQKIIDERGLHQLRATARATIAARRSPAHRVDVVLMLEQHAQRLFDIVRRERGLVERHERRGPVERLGDARRLVQIERAQLLHERRHLLGQPLRRAGHFGADDPPFLLEVRVSIQL